MFSFPIVRLWESWPLVLVSHQQYSGELTPHNIIDTERTKNQEETKKERKIKSSKRLLTELKLFGNGDNLSSSVLSRLYSSTLVTFHPHRCDDRNAMMIKRKSDSCEDRLEMPWRLECKFDSCRITTTPLRGISHRVRYELSKVLLLVQAILVVDSFLHIIRLSPGTWQAPLKPALPCCHLWHLVCFGYGLLPIIFPLSFTFNWNTLELDSLVPRLSSLCWKTTNSQPHQRKGTFPEPQFLHKCYTSRFNPKIKCFEINCSKWFSKEKLMLQGSGHHMERLVEAINFLFTKTFTRRDFYFLFSARWLFSPFLSFLISWIV